MRLIPADIEYDSGDVEFVETATGVLREIELQEPVSFHSENTPKEGIKGREVVSHAGSMDVERDSCAEKANEKSERSCVSL